MLLTADWCVVALLKCSAHSNSSSVQGVPSMHLAPKHKLTS